MQKILVALARLGRILAAFLAIVGIMALFQGEGRVIPKRLLLPKHVRPDGRPHALFFEAIAHDRVQWRLNSSLDSWGGPYRWLNIDELRQAEAFIKAKILELVARLADPV